MGLQSQLQGPQGRGASLVARVSPAQSPGSWLWLRCHRVTGSCAWQAGGSQGAASFWQAAAWESLGDGRAQALRGGGALPRACLLRGAVPTRLGSGCCHPRRNQGPHQRLGRLRAHRDSDPRRTCVRVTHRAASQGPCSVPARVRRGRLQAACGRVSVGGGATLVEETPPFIASVVAAGQAVQGGAAQGGACPLTWGAGQARRAPASAPCAGRGPWPRAGRVQGGAAGPALSAAGTLQALPQSPGRLLRAPGCR